MEVLFIILIVMSANHVYWTHQSRRKSKNYSEQVYFCITTNLVKILTDIMHIMTDRVYIMQCRVCIITDRVS